MRVQAWLSITAMAGAFAAAAMHQVAFSQPGAIDAGVEAVVVPVHAIGSLAKVRSDEPRRVGVRHGCSVFSPRPVGVDQEGSAEGSGLRDDSRDVRVLDGDHSLRSGSASAVLTRNSSDGSEDARRLASRGR